MGLRNKIKKAAKGEVKLSFDPMGNDRARLAELRIVDVEPDPDQPRKNLGDISELKASIEQHGVLQPIIVSSIADYRYRLIAGERRYTAVKELNQPTIPAIIRTVEDHERIQLQIIENLHRKNLDPFEEALGYSNLKMQFNLTQENIAKQVGKSRTHVTQMLSLANIPESIREKIESLNAGGVKKSLSYDTLFQIAKQESPEKMGDLLESIKNGVSWDERRDQARKTKPRGTTAPQKAKTAYPTKYDTVVVVQSKSNAPLDKERIIRSLKEALEKVEQAGN